MGCQPVRYECKPAEHDPSRQAIGAFSIHRFLLIFVANYFPLAAHMPLNLLHTLYCVVIRIEGLEYTQCAKTCIDCPV